MFLEKVRILWNKKVGSLYYRIGLKCHRGYFGAKPGQFLMLRVSDRINPLLRRPFSIHRLIAPDGHPEGVELLYKVAGEGTQRLSRYKKGAYVDILGPLGNGFSIPGNCHHIFIVAGGIGVAPMLFMASDLKKKGIDLTKSMVFLGGRSRDDLLCEKDFMSLGIRPRPITEDGSAGEKGLVTDPLEMAIKKDRPDIICACGPVGMLRVVARIAAKHTVPCQVSIETIMACGMGACLGCAVAIKGESDKYLHACRDGPVFDANVLKI